MNTRTKRNTLRRKLSAVVTIAVLASACPALAAPPAPTLKVKPLPEGPDGIASAATSLMVGDFNGDGRPDLASAGRVHQGATETDLPALWFTQITHTWDSDLSLLPHDGFGGCVNAFTVDSRPEISWALSGGFVNDAGGRRQPAIWSAIDTGVDYTHPDLHVLDTPPNTSGEVLDVEAIEVGSHLIIVVCGRVTEIAGGSHAVVWAGTPEHGFSRDFLPPLVAGGDSVATSLSFVMSDGADRFFTGTAPAGVVGVSTDDDGNPQAVIWRRKNGNWQPPNPLGNLPGGNRSSAYTLTVSPNIGDFGGNAMLAGGQAENADGAMLPTLWASVGSDHAWGSHALPLIGSTEYFNQGRVNSLIRVDVTSIGFLAAGEASGPQGSAAAIWINQGEIPTAFFDLNDLAPNLPSGVTLREANGLARILEGEGIFWYALVGSATGSDGARHGFIGSLRLE